MVFSGCFSKKFRVPFYVNFDFNEVKKERPFCFRNVSNLRTFQIQKRQIKILIFSFFSMAKKNMIQRELKRQRLVMKYAQKRATLKKQMKEAISLKEKVAFNRKLQQLPRNSAPTRLHNRCLVTGRSKGYFRDFGLSRHVLREMAHEGLLPGVTKSSW
jgi:small subunit ribosomal protein S14